MKFKRFGAMLLALVMCTGVFSTTAFAYSDESATPPTTEKAETVETAPEKSEDKTSEEVPYTVTVCQPRHCIRADAAQCPFQNPVRWVSGDICSNGG